VLAALLALRLVRGSVPVVQVAQATTAEVGPGGAAVPVLSGAGYVVSADRYIAIGVRVAGRIDRYMVEEGDHVMAGDALVQLDARDYEAAVGHAEANVALARSTAALKRKQLARARTLNREGVISHDELDLRATEAETAAAQIDQAEAELRQARISLEYTTLRAPRSGVILAKLKEVGEIAVPGGFSGSGDLIRMANLEDLRGQVDITESELAKVRMGQPAELVPDAYADRRYAAHVVKLYPQVDRQKGTLRIEVQIERPDDFLWPDMSARITFLDTLPASGGAVVLVPRAAVREEAGSRFAWVVSEGRVRRLPLELGKEVADQVQVTTGLLGGERLVVGDPPALHDGQRVNVAAGR
jgi:RND family efflux transporter MFP subunit